jgi:hypothetical protein
MIWGIGSALGLLAILGYAVFVCGAILLWSNRLDVPTWVNDELGAVRRSVVRHAVSATFHGLREEAACKAYPTCFVRSLARSSRRRINRGAILLAIGPLLLLIDLLILNFHVYW